MSTNIYEVPEAMQMVDRSVTTTELVQMVKKWVQDDEQYDESERMSKQEMFVHCKRAIELRPPDEAIEDSLIHLIIQMNAANAPEKQTVEPEVVQPKAEVQQTEEVFPDANKSLSQDELTKLGAFKNGDLWFINRCYGCGQFGKEKCCGTINEVCIVRPDGTLTSYGRQAMGLDPIRVPKHEPVSDTVLQEDWGFEFSGVGELQTGGIKMYIENFLPEGVTFLASLPKEHKTHLALSVVKALTTGQPLMGRKGYEVPEITPCLYLAVELSDRQFRRWADAFGITHDKRLFQVRTLNKGQIGLSNPNLEAATRAMKPVIVLDVLACFNEADDENKSLENQKLRGMINNLRRAGAKAVVILHHSVKTFKSNPTKENALRGSGDIEGMADCIWMLLKDDRLASSGIDEVNVIGIGKDFMPVSFRFAATRKATPTDLFVLASGVVSIIDTEHDLKWLDPEAAKIAAQQADQTVGDTLETMIKVDPTLTVTDLAEKTGETRYRVNTLLTERGWSKPAGRAKKGQTHKWVKRLN